jgi:hypothetical protein
LCDDSTSSANWDAGWPITPRVLPPSSSGRTYRRPSGCRHLISASTSCTSRVSTLNSG